MTPDLPSRVREALTALEVVEAVAKAIYEGPDQYGRRSSVTWTAMLTYGGAVPGNTDHPIADNFREMAREALAAIPPAAVIAVVQEDRTREIVERLREIEHPRTGNVYVAARCIRDEFGGSTHD